MNESKKKSENIYFFTVGKQYKCSVHKHVCTLLLKIVQITVDNIHNLTNAQKEARVDWCKKIMQKFGQGASQAVNHQYSVFSLSLGWYILWNPNNLIYLSHCVFCYMKIATVLLQVPKFSSWSSTFRLQKSNPIYQ